MREIKFRAWCKDLHIMLPCEEITAAVNPYAQITLPDILERDCYILMQYTGLKDKNQVEIYEGDVCHHPNDSFGRNAHVYWAESQTGFWYEPVGELRQFGCHFNAKQTENIEVIGNIYENPELLGPPHQPGNQRSNNSQQ